MSVEQIQRMVSARWPEIDALAQQLAGRYQSGWRRGFAWTEAAQQLGIPIDSLGGRWTVGRNGQLQQATSPWRDVGMGALALGAPLATAGLVGAFGGGGTAAGEIGRAHV